MAVYLLVGLCFPSVLSVQTSRFLHWPVLRSWAARTKTKFDDLALELIRGPLKIICFVVLIRIGLEMLSWPAWLAEAFSRILTVVIALSLTYLALKLIDLALGYWSRRVPGRTTNSSTNSYFPLSGIVSRYSSSLLPS